MSGFYIVSTYVYNNDLAYMMIMVLAMMVLPSASTATPKGHITARLYRSGGPEGVQRGSEGVERGSRGGLEGVQRLEQKLPSLCFVDHQEQQPVLWTPCSYSSARNGSVISTLSIRLI
jgi:hypothetical protein